MRILVIGAGASGLVTAKTAREAGHEVRIVEAGSAIGGTFVNKTYKDARMVSSKYLTCFSDFRRPEAEMHMTMTDYVLYLQEYSAHFGLLELIRFNVKVINVQKGCDAIDSYDVTLQADGDDSHPYVEVWDAVAICSGLHNVPRIPEFPGQQKFEGQILHSANYKDPEIFKGRKVLIIGTGETAFDLGYAAATNGAQSVTMSTRHGFVSVPACFGENNPPLDCVIMNWATHAWESKWAQRVGMHWWVTTKFTRLGFLFTTGCSYGFNQWVGKRYNMTWDDGRKHIVNKSSKCMPLLSRAAKKKVSWLRRTIYSWMDGEYNEIPDIDLVEGSVRELQPDGVVYDTATGEQRVNTDLLVLATGYRQRFPFLHGEGDTEDPLPQRHFLVDPRQPRLSYIGFIRPNVGAARIIWVETGRVLQYEGYVDVCQNQPRLSDFWKIVVGVIAGLLLLGVIFGFLQAMTTEPGLQLRRSLLPALTVSSDGSETVLNLCQMYASRIHLAEVQHRFSAIAGHCRKMAKEIDKMPCFEEADEALKWCRRNETSQSVKDRVERAQVVLQLLLEVLCMAWVVFAAVFGVKEGHPLDSSCYRLTDSRLCYGVDYGYYMFALAKEMGAAPSLRHWLWRDWRVMLTCAFGQAHVPIFRLQGPFRSAACQATCRSELYKVLWTRPVVMNLTFLIEAIAFGVINGVAALLESGRGRCLMGMGLGMLAFRRSSWPKLLD
eukprot:s1261_g27.t1